MSKNQTVDVTESIQESYFNTFWGSCWRRSKFHSCLRAVLFLRQKQKLLIASMTSFTCKTDTEQFQFYNDHVFH